ncbi:diphthine synthase [Candidatus Woesearchaeota archaeon]|nr:diphthine synthase [Candidatus Woesearchaeota archaeon]
MLYLVGLGLSDEKDISVRGLEIVKSCSKVFLEAYTSKLLVDKSKLEEFYGCSVIEADRDMVEKNASLILEPALSTDIALLVVGDPFGATTHSDLFLRAHEMGVKVRVIHNVSILNAIGETGLELYKFGKTTSITFPEPSFKPQTCYDVLKLNKSVGFHTLCLLDIKADQGRFMTVNEGISYLLDIEKERGENIFTPDTICVGVARLGSSESLIVSGKASELLDYDFGKPLHSLIVPGNMHFMEEDMLNVFRI